jgi:hypothetical protein
MSATRADLATLFGLPLVLERDDALTLAEDLRALLERQLGRVVKTVDADLTALAEVFDPSRPGSSLRDALGNLPPPPVIKSRLLKRSGLLIDAEGACLVGPEARLALEVMSDALSDPSDPVVVPVSAPCMAQAELYARYREWVFQRIETALRLSSGRADTMRPLTAAWLLFLLVNGSRGVETGVLRPPSSVDEARLEGAIANILHAFADTIATTDRPVRPFGLDSNWVLSEASRRAPDVMGEHRRRAGEPKIHYLRPGSEARTVAIIARELSRRRNPPSPALIQSAFDRLVAEYRRQLPILASAGMAHENRAATRQIQIELERALDRHAPAS